MQNDNEKFKNEFIKRLIKFSLEIIKFCEIIRKDRNLWSIADQFSLKSANETKYWLTLVKECNQELRQKAEVLLQESTEIANIIAAGILTMKGKR